MLLYIHVPFCRRKCHYCAFFSLPHSADLEVPYLKALKREIAFRGKQLKDRNISSIYIGGGTPTLLSISSLRKIMNKVCASFRLHKNMEFTFEANPETINDPNYLSALRSLGINRISLGVQSLDDEILYVLGRRHTSTEAIRSVGMLQDAGFENLSIDLIWGLPGQSLKMWMQDLRTVVKLRPKHISCYGLSIEPDTFLGQHLEQGQVELPEEHFQAKMYVHGAEYLESESFLQYEVSNFSKMGYVCLHNTGYWEGRDYIGLGPSAVSLVDGFRWKNPSSLDGYAALTQDSFSGLEKEDLGHEVWVREKIMLSLRTAKGLNLKEYRQMTGHDFCRRFGPLLKALHSSNLIRMANGYVRLTKNGMLVSNSIIERFIF
ncbi:MAG: radical SAM family heme chaperone HemW [Desulfonatronovibrio sp. MSAO_Bac4]|nr:MAG: radical SAM family heme chaperone HemW [Desulfonatronovibrio sp. MSAO_Bac4]